MRSSIGAHCNGRSRTVRVGGLLVACALLAGLAACGTQFVYNRLDWLTHYYLSSQVSLDGAQSPRVKRGAKNDVVDLCKLVVHTGDEIILNRCHRKRSRRRVRTRHQLI